MKLETHAHVSVYSQIRYEYLERRISNYTFDFFQKMAPSRLDGVLTPLALACRWPCADLRFVASGLWAASTPSPSRSTSTLATERRGEERVRREREDKKCDTTAMEAPHPDGGEVVDMGLREHLTPAVVKWWVWGCRSTSPQRDGRRT
jgi:hypothetical protein